MLCVVRPVIFHVVSTNEESTLYVFFREYAGITIVNKEQHMHTYLLQL